MLIIRLILRWLLDTMHNSPRHRMRRRISGGITSHNRMMTTNGQMMKDPNNDNALKNKISKIDRLKRWFNRIQIIIQKIRQQRLINAQRKKNIDLIKQGKNTQAVKVNYPGSFDIRNKSQNNTPNQVHNIQEDMKQDEISTTSNLKLMISRKIRKKVQKNENNI